MLRNRFEITGSVGKKIDMQAFESGAMLSTLHIYRCVGENKFDTYYVRFWDTEDTLFSEFIADLKEGEKVHVSGSIRGSYYKNKNNNDIYKIELLGSEISKVQWNAELGINGDYELLQGENNTISTVRK